MTRPNEDTLVDLLKSSATADPLPGWKSATGLDYPTVLDGLIDLYGSLERLFRTPLHRDRPRLDLNSPDSDD